MCGLAGFLIGNSMAGDSISSIVQAMGDVIRHRGPDDGEVWVDSDAGVALAHRRLAIIDVSPSGRQPMVSHSGRYVIVYNGEIYNHLELRRDLKGVPWRGTSDTESLLAAVDQWGLEVALRRSIGMFALALWDREERVLSLARDRLGEKPLYYGRQGSDFLFASELKSIYQHPAFEGNISRIASSFYFRHGYVPAPYSIFEGISKLSPGELVDISVDGAHGLRVIRRRKIWNLAEQIQKRNVDEVTSEPGPAIAALEDLLIDAISRQMVADVPLGCFLSGGIDSSTVAAIMQRQSRSPIRTFSIGFEDDAYDESGYARSVARHIGSDHVEMHVSPEVAQSIIPKLPEMYDEPFADSSQIPTYFVSKLAREKVTVALSGDGGDELFGGYTRYQLSDRLFSRLTMVPGILRTAANGAARLGDASGILELLARSVGHTGRGKHAIRLGDKILKAGHIVDIRQREAFYYHLISQWERSDCSLVKQIVDVPVSDVLTDGSGLDYYEWMMYFDTLTYLPDDILVKVDRAAMAVSLETRVPFLDNRVVEMAWRLPLSLKYRNGQGKWILKQLLAKYVPPELFERPKKGFGVPIGDWLKGPLRDWAETLISERRLESEGIIYSAPVQVRWREHLKGHRNWSSSLWAVLMFQAWYEYFQSDFCRKRAPAAIVRA